MHRQRAQTRRGLITLIKDDITFTKIDIKKTWKTKNDTLGRGRNQSKLPTYIVDNEKKMTNPEKIANTFNNYFANIGTNFASTKSNDQTETYTQYLQTQSAISCIFRHITEEETITIIDKMENKSSSGYDGISNTMLKHINKEISKPLTLIINQMLDSGIFPSGPEISKILPIYKKGDVNLLNNY